MKSKRKKLTPAQQKKRFEKRERRAREAARRAAEERRRKRLREQIERRNAEVERGYDLSGEGRVAEACDQWWEVWNGFKATLTDGWTIADVEDEFSDRHYFVDWICHFAEELHQAAVDAPHYADRGIEFCTAILAQLAGRDRSAERFVRSDFRADVGEFHFLAGRDSEGERVLEDLIRDEPDRAIGYVRLASRLESRGRRNRCDADIQCARELLERAVARPVKDAETFHLELHLRYLRADDRAKLDILRDAPDWQWPADAADLIAETLADRQASGRIIAAELAGEFAVMSDDMATALLALIGDGDESDAVRATAARSFGAVLEDSETMEFDDDEAVISETCIEQIQEVLHAAYLDADLASDIRRRALEASVCAPRDWHRAAVKAAYESTDQAWHHTALCCLEYIRGFDEEILRTLDSEDAHLRFHAIRAAKNAQLAAAWSHLSRLACDNDAEKALRMTAISALPHIRADQAAPLLAQLADSAEDRDIALAASCAHLEAELSLR
ncbi:MAG: hypothetical protein MJE77_18500 [Proteobacteria bacterium]|nr:hypothetical protein [Pseudomonadota bacterium]